MPEPEDDQSADTDDEGESTDNQTRDPGAGAFDDLGDHRSDR